MTEEAAIEQAIPKGKTTFASRAPLSGKNVGGGKQKAVIPAT